MLMLGRLLRRKGVDLGRECGADCVETSPRPRKFSQSEERGGSERGEEPMGSEPEAETSTAQAPRQKASPSGSPSGAETSVPAPRSEAFGFRADKKIKNKCS